MRKIEVYTCRENAAPPTPVHLLLLLTGVYSLLGLLHAVPALQWPVLPLALLSGLVCLLLWFAQRIGWGWGVLTAVVCCLCWCALCVFLRDDAVKELYHAAQAVSGLRHSDVPFTDCALLLSLLLPLVLYSLEFLLESHMLPYLLISAPVLFGPLAGIRPSFLTAAAGLAFQVCFWAMHAAGLRQRRSDFALPDRSRLTAMTGVAAAALLQQIPVPRGTHFYSGQDLHLVEARVDHAVSLSQRPAVQQQDIPSAGELHRQVIHQKGLACARISRQGDNRYGNPLCHAAGLLKTAVALQRLQNLPPEIRLLIGQKIPARQKFLRLQDGGNQIILCTEKTSDVFLHIFPEDRPLHSLRQLGKGTFFQIPMVIQTVQGVCLHHIGIGQDRPRNMRQIIPVLFQLPADPLLFDRFAFQFYIQGTASVRRQLQEVKFLADMFNRIGKIKTVKKRDPVQLSERSSPAPLPACCVVLHMEISRRNLLAEGLRQTIHERTQRSDFMRAVGLLPAAPAQRL